MLECLVGFGLPVIYNCVLDHETSFAAVRSIWREGEVQCLSVQLISSEVDSDMSVESS